MQKEKNIPQVTSELQGIGYQSYTGVKAIWVKTSVNMPFSNKIWITTWANKRIRNGLVNIN